jgi:hypothetical protein
MGRRYEQSRKAHIAGVTGSVPRRCGFTGDSLTRNSATTLHAPRSKENEGNVKRPNPTRSASCFMGFYRALLGLVSLIRYLFLPRVTQLPSGRGNIPDRRFWHSSIETVS